MIKEYLLALLFTIVLFGCIDYILVFSQYNSPGELIQPVTSAYYLWYILTVFIYFALRGKNIRIFPRHFLLIITFIASIPLGIMVISLTFLLITLVFQSV